MVAFRFTTLAALAIAAPLHALLFTTGHHRGAARRLANAGLIPAPIEGRVGLYGEAFVKRSGPKKEAHCGGRFHGGRPSNVSTSHPAATTTTAKSEDTVADVVTTTTTPAAVATTTTKVQATTTHRTTTTKAATTTSSAATSGSTTSGSTDDGLTDSQESTFLSLHNSIRSEHGASALTWSDELAAAAKSWADKCVFEHSKGALGPYGENLAAGTGSAYDVAAAMKSWTDEESEYDPSNPTYSHYTQIVWKSTKQVGCALAPACSGIFPASYGAAKYFVCEYYPAGNVIGEFAENVQ